MKQTRCKVVAGYVAPTYPGSTDSEQVQLYGVCPNKENKEDDSFASASPSVNFSIVISNPEARGFFKQGKKYYATFEEAPEPNEVPATAPAAAA